MRHDIEEFRIEREVKQLLHFTRAQNLPSIVRHGLVPRAQLDLGIIRGKANDNRRLDGRKGYNCVSLSFPNAPMFYRFQRDNPGVEWVIISMSPRILATHDVLFCWRNAAAAGIAATASGELSTLQAFHGLFIERDGLPSRDKQKLRACDPTSVQAEVLVRGKIAPEHFQGVYFPNKKCLEAYKPLIGGMRTKIGSRRGIYGTRDFFLNS